MKLLLSFTLLVVFSFIRFASGQTLEDAFAKSYSFEKQGKFTDASAALKALYDQNNYGLNLRLGYLYEEAAQYNVSESYYAIAVALKPNSVEAKLGYVLPLSAEGNWSKVSAVYDDILKIDPQNTLVNYRVGYIAYNNKDYKKAFTYFDKVVSLYPFDYDSVLMLAWTYLQLGKTAEAKTLFTEVLYLSPNDTSAKDGLSRIK